jgi:heat shock protein HslJ
MKPFQNIVILVLVASTTSVFGQGEGVKPPTPEDAAGATYRGIYDEPVQLQRGVYVGPPFEPGAASRPRVEIMRGFLETGDLNGDGNEEATVLLSESSGGSGTQLYMAVLGRSDEGIVNLDTVLVGDRVQVRAARVSDTIELDVIQPGPDDAACCPSEKATRKWAFKNDELEEMRSEVTGRLSLNDLVGSKWVLTQLTQSEQVPTEPEVTLLFESTRVSGSGGCNRFFAQVQGGAPGELTIGPLGSTRRACPEADMDLEQRYFKLLGRAMKYGFFPGRLVLTVRDNGGLDTLIFVQKISPDTDS